jgi:hypothetical protein
MTMLKVALLDPSIKSENIGDLIIRQSVLKQLSSVVEVTDFLPTQVGLTRQPGSIL